LGAQDVESAPRWRGGAWILFGIVVGVVYAEVSLAMVRLYQLIPEHVLGNLTYVLLGSMAFFLPYVLFYAVISLLLKPIFVWRRGFRRTPAFVLPGLGIFVGWISTHLLVFVPVIGEPQRAYTAWLDEIESQAFHDFAERADPVIEAVEAYRAAHGVCPESLDTLIPEYLDTPPRTGFHNPTEFRVMPEDCALLVPLHTGTFDFNRLVYAPESTGRELRINERRFGKWIYFDD
jgi:hypothetical protein